MIVVSTKEIYMTNFLIRRSLRKPRGISRLTSQAVPAGVLEA